MKLDIKSILILILLGLTILFGFKWFFSGDKVSKERVKQLEQQFKDLENQKKVVDLEINSWRAKSDSLRQLDIKLQAELTKQEAQTKKAEIEANKSKPTFVFYDGPPFATGLPHYGHILAGFIKDSILRFKKFIKKL